MISIIVPIYNAEKYLNECLDSILNQTYNDFEVLCINDGSSDNSEEICKRASIKDGRIKYFSQNNGGVSKARNTGINNAKGEYLCFVDADDVIDKDFLSNLIAASVKYDLVVCDYTRQVDELGTNKDEIFTHEAISYINEIIDEKNKHPNICMMLFQLSVIKDYNLFFVEGCVRNEDAEFYLKYMSHIDSIAFINYKGYFYRDNPSSAVHKFNKKSLTYIEASERIKKYLEDRNIIDDNCRVVDASVQYFVYHLARQGNKELYEFLHEEYEVSRMMHRLISFPRISRRCLACVYLILGKRLFFKAMFSLFSK